MVVALLLASAASAAEPVHDAKSGLAAGWTDLGWAPRDLARGAPDHNVIYRCAGDREAPRIPFDGEPQPQSGAMNGFVNHDVMGFARTTADATLGNVYATAAADRVPVYALDDPGPFGDNTCYFMRWNESQVKST